MNSTTVHRSSFLLLAFLATVGAENATETGEQEMADANQCLGFEAHFVTYVILQSAMMVTPFYLLATWVYSGASVKPAMELAWIWLVMGGIMSTFALFDVDGKMGTIGNLTVPIAWFLPSTLLIVFRNRYHCEKLSQHWLVGLQLFRSIGGIFLIEMVRGNLPSIFAYPAGIGDLLVALVALIILIKHRNDDVIPSWEVYFLIGVGLLDFASAFFFGFFSSDQPARIFYHDVPYNPTTYPSGLIPLFLVPYAIFFHTLSYINEKRYFSGDDVTQEKLSTDQGEAEDAEEGQA